ncbi:MAG: T9SS type A sorting domain-containing protein [Bacteroidetes bacterium]|nr:T9SS type A sorting domain-containing protein [Bacteroidota bacterium]
MLKSYLSKFFALALLLGTSYGAFAQNVIVTSPANIAGNYPARPAVFGPALTDITGELVLADDGTLSDPSGDGNPGTVNDGCDPIMNNVSGKIALIDRGECGFVVKAQSAQDAGAIAVVICNNNTAAPDAVIYMGGTDPGTFTIPTVMLSYNSCQTIKSELANGTVMGGTVVAAASESCETALTAVEGLNSAPAPTGGGALLNDAVSGLFYKFTPTSDALMTVSSCAGAVDTRLFIFGDGCDVLTDLGDNDDCDFDNGVYGSEVSIVVTAGTEYVIYWDDVWENAPFDWTLTLSAIPDIAVTFQVDMKNETVAPDGVKVSINGVAEEDMTDSGNGIWSYTSMITAGNTATYIFSNGAGNAETNPDLTTCREIVVGLDAFTTDLVCYNSCTICPPDVSCPNWIQDDFESYTLGGISAQAAHWGPWTPGSTTEDAVVVNTTFNSGSQAMQISAAGSDDQLLILGDRTSGHYILKWKMYVPTGSGGYYNLQKAGATPGVGDAFANEVVFNIDGTGSYSIGGGTVAFTYPHDTWFEVYHDIDLDNNWTRVWYDGVAVTEHPSNWQAGSQDGITQIGGVDMYGFPTVSTNYFVDDVLFKEIPTCPANALICDGFDGYDLGLVGPQSPWWTGWSQVDGDADDGTTTNLQFASCEQSLLVSAANSDDIILLLGNRPSGNYSLSWNMYVPTGSQGYYNIQKDTDKLPSNAGTADYGLEVYFNANGAGTVSGGGQNSSTFDYPYDTWFNVQHLIDLDNNTASVWINGVMVQEWSPSWDYLNQTAGGVKQLGGVDFYGATNVLYYVDDVLLEELPAAPGNICAAANDIDQYFGQGVGSVTSTPLYDNTGNTTTPSDPTTGYECFGEPDGGGASPELNNTVWFTFTGDGETYLIETNQCNSTNYITDGDTQMAIYSGDCDNLTPVDCNEDSPMATSGNYFSAIELATTPGTVYYMMVDGFSLNGAVSVGEYCLKITQITGTPTVDVTFRVNMEKEASVNPQGVRIAGSMTGWTDEVMTDLGNDIWEITLELPVGDVIQYKFKNGPNGWETNDDLMDCGIDDGNGAFNRQNTIGSTNETLGTYCFNWCVDCALVGTNETVFAKSVGVNPNPAGDYVNLTYNFENLTNLDVRLVNSLGQLMVERRLDNAVNGSERLNISSLPSGAYTVVFSNGEQSVAKRLIVQ